jgi:hypothetical protein
VIVGSRSPGFPALKGDRDSYIQTTRRVDHAPKARNYAFLDYFGLNRHHRLRSPVKRSEEKIGAFSRVTVIESIE